MDSVSDLVYSANIYLMDLILDTIAVEDHQGPIVQGFVGFVVSLVIIPVYIIAYGQGLLLGPFILLQMPFYALQWIFSEDYRKEFDPKTEDGRKFIKFYQRMNIIRFNFKIPDDYEVTWKTFLDIYWLQIRLYMTVQYATILIPIVLFWGIFI